MKTLSQKLPPEILTLIFEWIYFISVGEPGYHIAVGKDVRQLCWPVSQVCRFWREVALATPFLWTHLPTLNLDDEKSPSASQQLECLEALIPRTRNRGLHIKAVGSNDGDFDDCLKVVNYIVQYCERWETLFVKASPDYLDYYFEDIRGCLPRLEVLILSLLDGDGAELTLFEDAPNLKAVHIRGVPGGWIFLDTHALLHLHDDTAMIVHNLQAIHGYPKLISLDVIDTGEEFDYTELSDDDVVLFPALKTLEYSCDDSFPVDFGFLTFVEAPVLEDLTISASEGDAMGCIMDLYSRSGSLPLKSLYLLMQTDGLHEQAFSDLFKLFPELESLDINLPPIRDLIHLADFQGTEVLPRLRKCTFILPENPNVIEDDVHHAIAGMAQSCCNRPQTPSPNANVSTDPAGHKDVAGIYMQLTLEQEVPLFIDPPVDSEQPQYSHPGIVPVKLESWYHSENKGHIVDDTNSEDRDIRTRHRSSRIQRKRRHNGETVYAKFVSAVVSSMSPGNRGVDSKSSGYNRILDLITRMETEYEPENLVDFLAENTNVCLIFVAFMLKDNFPHVPKADGTHPYGQVVRILKRVKSDLLQKLDKFHWAWKTQLGSYTLQYIHDHHEIRGDPDKFANAILDLSDELWILEDS